MGIDHWQAENVELPPETDLRLDGTGLTEEQILAKAVLFTYDIRKDDQTLREAPADFERLRGDYPVRREFPAFTLISENVRSGTIEKLKTLGFKIKKKS